MGPVAVGSYVSITPPFSRRGSETAPPGPEPERDRGYAFKYNVHSNELHDEIEISALL